MKHSLSLCEKSLKKPLKTLFATGNKRFGLLLLYALCLPLSGALAQVSPVDSGMRDQKKQEQQTETTVQTTTEEDKMRQQTMRFVLHFGETNDYIDTNFGFIYTGESKLVKNWANIGVMVGYHALYGNDTEFDSIMIGVYASGFAPLNYLFKSGDKNRGFFPYFQVGLGYSYASMLINNTASEDSNIDIFTGMGIDWRITRGFGLSLYFAEFDAVFFGVNFTLR